MSQVTYLFSAKEILQQIHRELIKLGVDLNTHSIDAWKEYILARAIEEILLVQLQPMSIPSMETIAKTVLAQYRRIDNNHTYTLDYDVGTNKLFQCIGSKHLPFESNLQLYRDCVILSSRKVPLPV